MNRRYAKIITYKEFEKLAEGNSRYIFPVGYEELTPNALGIIIDNTFILIETSVEAEKYLNYNRNFFQKKEEDELVYYFKKFTHSVKLNEQVILDSIKKLKNAGWNFKIVENSKEVFLTKEGYEDVQMWWYINNRNITHAMALDFNDPDQMEFGFNGVTEMFETMTEIILED